MLQLEDLVKECSSFVLKLACLDASDFSRAALCMSPWKSDAQMLLPGTLPSGPGLTVASLKCTVSDKMIGSCHGDKQMHIERDAYRKKCI